MNDQLIQVLISALGGILLSCIAAFWDSYTKWLDKFAPDKKYFISGAISAAAGVIAFVLLTCTGVLQLLDCSDNLPTQLLTSGLAGWGGNQTAYNGLRTLGKVQQQAIADQQSSMPLPPNDPDGAVG